MIDAPSSLITHLSLAPLRVWRSYLICTYTRTHARTYASCWHDRLFIFIYFNYFLLRDCTSLRQRMPIHAAIPCKNTRKRITTVRLHRSRSTVTHSPGHLTTSNYINTSSVHMLSPSLGLAWLGLAWLGLAWLGLAWLGLAWLGLAWLGLADTPST